MVHAVSATFVRFERMSPPAAGMALLLHVLVAAFLIWAPTHHPDEPDDPIEVTMEEPPPPPPAPEPKPEPKPETKPEVQKPPPKAAPPPQQQTTTLPGLAPRGAIGPKNTAPPMERGPPTDELPPEKAEQQKPKDEAPPPQVLEQQALARLAEPPPPPPPPTLEKELPPVETPPPPVTARDLPRIAPPVPERKPEPPPKPVPPPQHQQAQPPRPPAGPQLQPSPLSRLPRNAPSQQRQTEQRSTFVNPADTYAMNTVAESYQYRVVDQVGRYQANLTGAAPTDSIVVRFTIARNGSLLSIAVVQSSGKPAIDRGLITAFQTVAPFPPLPSEIPGDSATFTLAFGPRFKQR